VTLPATTTTTVAPTTTTLPCVARAQVSKAKAAGSWKGRWLVNATATVPGNSCTSAWEGTVALVVRENGTVGGTSNMHATQAPTCVGGFTGVAAATQASLVVNGTFTGSEFLLRFSASSINGFDAGFHVLYYPGPPTVRVPLISKSTALGVFVPTNLGPEELAGGGGTAQAVGLAVLKRG
jgi:hypothetical protein